MAFVGTKRNDQFTGTNGADQFKLGKGGNDTANGRAGNDHFYLGASLTASDRLNGGNGFDQLRLYGDYTGAHSLTFTATTMTNFEALRLMGGYSYDLTTADTMVAAGKVMWIRGGFLGAGDTMRVDGSAETDGELHMTAGHGDDVLSGGAQADAFKLRLGGNDTVNGNGGDDRIYFLSALTAADRVDGGAGNDAVWLNGSYATGFTIGASVLTSVERFGFRGAHSYNLKSSDGNIAAGKTLAIDASALSASHHLTFNGSAETNGSFAFIGGAGNDTLTGGAKADMFDLTAGGNDTVRGGKGNDTFDFGREFASGDSVDGGAGSNTLRVSGVYNNGNPLLLDDTHVTHIAKLAVVGGTSAAIAQVTGDITGGTGTLTIDGTAASGTFAYLLNATSSHYVFTGGHGDDGIVLGSNLHTTDRIDGGGGDDGMTLLGGYSAGFTFGAENLISVERVQLTGSDHYDLTTVDANVASGATLTVYGSNGTLTSVRWNGAAETDGHFAFTGAGGDDELIGGALSDTFDLSAGGDDTVLGGGGNDTFNFGHKISSADSIDGGSGSNTLVVSGNFTGGQFLMLDDTKVTHIQKLVVEGNTSVVGAAIEGNITGGGGTLTIDGSQASQIGVDLSLATSAGYNIIGSNGDDGFGFYLNLHSSDSINGGDGDDSLSLIGDYTSTYTFGANNLISIEKIELIYSRAYDFATVDANVASGATLTVDALNSPNTIVYWDGSAETDGHFALTGGGGGDVLIGGALSDTFDLSTPGPTGDRATGGGGADTFTLVTPGFVSHDTLVFNHVSDSTGTAYDTVKNVDFSKLTFEISSFATLPAAIDTAVTTGSLSSASFNANLAAAAGAGQLGSHHAVLFTADAGGLSGETFLVVDVNGTAGYQTNQDLVIHLDDRTGVLDTSDFA